MAKTKSEDITLLSTNTNGTADFAPTARMRTHTSDSVTYTCTLMDEADRDIFGQVLNMKHTAKIKEDGEVTVRFDLEGEEIEILREDGSMSIMVKPKKDDARLFAKSRVISVKLNGQMTCQIAFACKKLTKRSLNPEVSDR